MTTREKFLSFYYEKMEQLPEIKIDPKTTALMLVDLQNQFVLKDFGDAKKSQESGDYERWAPFYDRLNDIVVPNAERLLNLFRKNNLCVTYGRIACMREDGEDRSPVQKTEGWNGIFLPIDDYATQMVESLAPKKNEVVFNKTTDSVTTGTNCLQVLRFMGIKTVVVSGIVTDQCVASTVRGLADDGLKVICVEDACAAATMELHEAELRIMNMIYCDVMSTDEVLELFSNYSIK